MASIYEEFINNKVLKLQYNVELFNVVYNRLRYWSEDENSVTVIIPLVLTGGISRNNIADWKAIYPDFFPFADSLIDFAVTTGSVIVSFAQKIYLNLDKRKLDAIINYPKDFELDASILNNVEFGDAEINVIGTTELQSDAKIAALKSLNFPISDYNEIYDLLVTVE